MNVPHEAGLIGTLTLGLGSAFVGGLVAQRLRLPVIVGYLLAGIVVGPFTPGFVADTRLAPQLAEIGVILLMFGVGVHFSIEDLLAVRRIALPGAAVTVAVVTLIGSGLARLWGWDPGAGVVYGLALGFGSTVVALRTIASLATVSSRPGRVTVGWLVVEDLIAVTALVLLPALHGSGGADSAGTAGLLATIGLTLGKAAVFVALMLVAGARLVPRLLRTVEQTGSRELFVLGTLAVALGIAYAATQWFGVSSALGAFLAGVVINEADLSHRVAKEALPFQEAFAVLFFVSVGMTIDPMFVLTDLPKVLATLVVIVVGKGGTAWLMARWLGGHARLSTIVATSVAQIGEFSFILAAAAASLGVLPPTGQSLILAGSLGSILVSPLLVRLARLSIARTAPTAA